MEGSYESETQTQIFKNEEEDKKTYLSNLPIENTLEFSTTLPSSYASAFLRSPHAQGRRRRTRGPRATRTRQRVHHPGIHPRARGL